MTEKDEYDDDDEADFDDDFDDDDEFDEDDYDDYWEEAAESVEQVCKVLLCVSAAVEELETIVDFARTCLLNILTIT